MRSVLVDLKISSENYMKMYQGVAENVFARTLDGRTVSFPARILRPFLLHDGIKGRFRISFSDQGKYQGIEKLS